MTLHLTLSTDEVNDNGQCSKDDLNCKSKQSEIIDEAKYNAYEHRDVTSREDFLIHQELDEIDELKSSRFLKHSEILFTNKNNDFVTYDSFNIYGVFSELFPKKKNSIAENVKFQY